MTVKLYQVNIVTTQSILCTNFILIWNHRNDLGCQNWFKMSTNAQCQGEKERNGYYILFMSFY